MDGAVRMTYREACRQAIRDALARDPRAFVMGEDVGKYGGCYAVTKGLLEEFGPERIIDTPLAEAGIAATGIGENARGCAPGGGSRVPPPSGLRAGPWGGSWVRADFPRG